MNINEHERLHKTKDGVTRTPLKIRGMSYAHCWRPCVYCDYEMQNINKSVFPLLEYMFKCNVE
jgi:hypothetical protein